MKKANWLFFVAFAVIAMGLGCGEQPAPEPSAAPAEPAAPAAGDAIGVAECDDYLKKVETCIAEHVPEDAQAMQRQSMDDMRNQWRQAAENPTAREGLAAGCKAALDTARSTFAAYGCEW